MKGTTPEFEKYEQSMGLFLYIDIDNEIEIQIYEIHVSHKNVLNKYQYVKQYFFAFGFTLQNLRKKFPQKWPVNITTWTSGAIMQGIKYEGKALGKYSKKMMKSISRKN